MGPLAFLAIKQEHLGALQLHLHSLESFWNLLDSFESFWNLLDSFGIFLNVLESF